MFISLSQSKMFGCAVKVEITEDDEMYNSSDATESIRQKNPIVQESSDGSGPAPGPSTKPRAKVR